MRTYTELSNVNSLEDVDCIDSDETSWKLINAKILYKSGDIFRYLVIHIVIYRPLGCDITALVRVHLGARLGLCLLYPNK